MVFSFNLVNEIYNKTIVLNNLKIFILLKNNNKCLILKNYCKYKI